MSKQEEIIQQAINYALVKFNTQGKNLYWNEKGYLNVRELYKGLLSTPGFDTNKFKATSEFESYIKYNIRKFGLIGKIDISGRRKADKFAEAELIIENCKDALVAFENANDNDYVIRTKLGNGRVRIYSHGKLSIHEINQLKAAYKIVEGVKYFDVRPCLYKNWKNWPDERQQASSAKDISFVR